MARPPRTRRISADDYQDAPDWFKRFLDQMNVYLGDSATAFDDILTENRSRQTEEVKFTTSASGTVSNVKLKNRLPKVPVSVEIGQIRPTSGSSSTAIAVGKPIWKMVTGNFISIDHIGGLSNSTEYRATFIVT